MNERIEKIPDPKEIEKEIKRMKDTWTFARKMDSEDPNWRLVATGE